MGRVGEVVRVGRVVDDQYVTFGKFCILYVLLQRLVGKFQTLALTIFK